MPELACIPGARRSDLVLSELGDNGQLVVKDPRTGNFYRLRQQEAFLLTRLDGEQSAASISAAFTARFGEPLSAEDLGQFLELVRAKGFLQPSQQAPGPAVGSAGIAQSPDGLGPVASA